MLRVLVTGGCGFLGRHLVNRLAAMGNHVDVVDINGPSSDLLGRYFCADVCTWLPQTQNIYDVVFHLAALVGGRQTIEYEPLVIRRNATIDQAVFEYMARVQHGQLIYMSSSAVYPVERQRTLDAVPLTENEVDTRSGPIGIPDLTYGWTKLSGEFTATLLHDRLRLPITIYRPFTIYGPGQATSYPMTAIVLRALWREDPLIVWGSGGQRRDFVYVEDFLDIVLATFRSRTSALPLNIASGVGHSFIDVAQIVADVVGYSPRILADTRKPQGVLTRVGSAHQLDPHHRPKISLSDGVERIVKYLVQAP